MANICRNTNIQVYSHASSLIGVDLYTPMSYNISFKKLSNKSTATNKLNESNHKTNLPLLTQNKQTNKLKENEITKQITGRLNCLLLKDSAPSSRRPSPGPIHFPRTSRRPF